MKKLIPLLISILFLGACATARQAPAPIVNVTSPNQAPNVTSTAPAAATPPSVGSTSPAEDTSSSTTIAKANDDDEGTVVATPTPKASPTPPANKPAAKPIAVVADTAVASSAVLGGVNWLAPTQGKIVQPFNSTTKGVDVEGKEGQAIVAAADAKVAYSGNGLKGYGNLVILKHANGYLTAYSHNRINLVKEGDTVKRGQKIAELGKTESDRPILHFELRKSGKPIDPTPIFK